MQNIPGLRLGPFFAGTPVGVKHFPQWMYISRHGCEDWLSLQDAEFPGYMQCVHCAAVVR